MHRVADQLTLRIEQREIHAPGVHTQAGDGVCLRRGFAQAGEHLIPQREHIPAQMSAGAHGFVQEAMRFGELQLAAIECANDGSATLRAKVVCKIVLRCHLASVAGRVWRCK